MKIILIFTTLLASAALAAALPVEIVSKSHAKLTATVETQDGSLHVTGTVSSTLPGLHHPGAHVEVDLVGAKGHLLASVTDKVGPSTKHPRSASYGSERFTVTFSSEFTGKAELVRVIFHNHAHSACKGGC